MRAFMVYIRPIVEYNSIIWSPSTARDIDAVESVQRRFIKRLPTLKNLSYRERLKRLNIFSLELRRLICFGVIKLFFGLVYNTIQYNINLFSRRQLCHSKKE